MPKLMQLDLLLKLLEVAVAEAPSFSLVWASLSSKVHHLIKLETLLPDMDY